MQKKSKECNFKPDKTLKYIAFYKPYAVLCQFSKEAGTNKSTLADFAFPKEVYPVGRLDYDSEGLLLISNDGRLNQLLLDPRHAHERTYLVQVERIPDSEAIRKLQTGVILDSRRTLPAKVELLSHEPALPERSTPIRFRKNVATAWLSLVLIEGKNRQVRRMTAAVGYPTLRLVRTSIGSLQLAQIGLAPGAWKYLNADEIRLCFQ